LKFPTENQGTGKESRFQPFLFAIASECSYFFHVGLKSSCPANPLTIKTSMNHSIAIFVIGVFGAGSASPWGCGTCDKHTCPTLTAPCPPPPIVWEEKIITMYRPELKAHDVKDSVDQIYLHPEPCKEKYEVPELVKVPQTKKVCIPKLVPHEIVREVCCTRYVTEKVTDPCTGCVKTIIKTVPDVRKVVQTVYDIETVEQEVPIIKYCLKTEEKERTVAHLNADIKPMDIVRRSYSLELVPFQVKVRVPVCPEPSAPCK
jgi:hypothetical protein